MSTLRMPLRHALSAVCHSSRSGCRNARQPGSITTLFGRRPAAPAGDAVGEAPGDPVGDRASELSQSSSSDWSVCVSASFVHTPSCRLCSARGRVLAKHERTSSCRFSAPAGSTVASVHAGSRACGGYVGTRGSGGGGGGATQRRGGTPAPARHRRAPVLCVSARRRRCWRAAGRRGRGGCGGGLRTGCCAAGDAPRVRVRRRRDAGVRQRVSARTPASRGRVPAAGPRRKGRRAGAVGAVRRGDEARRGAAQRGRARRRPRPQTVVRRRERRRGHRSGRRLRRPRQQRRRRGRRRGGRRATPAPVAVVPHHRHRREEPARAQLPAPASAHAAEAGRRRRRRRRQPQRVGVVALADDGPACDRGRRLPEGDGVRGRRGGGGGREQRQRQRRERRAVCADEAVPVLRGEPVRLGGRRQRGRGPGVEHAASAAQRGAGRRAAGVDRGAVAGE
eukprot:Rhum_TRINITY_DN14401_c2_g1::Rhum_TRINITY_DN14401_c2_g1_i2::g.87343::m.87343